MGWVFAILAGIVMAYGANMTCAAFIHRFMLNNAGTARFQRVFGALAFVVAAILIYIALGVF